MAAIDFLYSSSAFSRASLLMDVPTSLVVSSFDVLPALFREDAASSSNCLICSSIPATNAMCFRRISSLVISTACFVYKLWPSEIRTPSWSMLLILMTIESFRNGVSANARICDAKYRGPMPTKGWKGLKRTGK